MRSVIRQFGIRAGLAEGDDPKQLPPGTLGVLENCVWRKQGRVDKRFGNTYLGNPSGSMQRLFTRGSELCAISQFGVYSYSSTGGWISRGNSISNVSLTWSTLNDGIAGASAADLAVDTNGNVTYAWVSGSPGGTGKVWLQRVDANGTILTAPTLIYSGADAGMVRVVTDGTTTVVLWMTSGGTILAYVNGTTTTIETGQANYNAFDACVIGANPTAKFVIAYARTSGAGGGIVLATYSFATTPVLATSGVVTGETSTAISAVGIAGGLAGAGYLYIVYIDTTAKLIRRAIANATTLVQTFAPLTIDTSATSMADAVATAAYVNGEALFAYSWDDGKRGVLIARWCRNTGAVGNPRTSGFARLLTKPFTLGSGQFAFVANYVTAASWNTGNKIFGADSYLIDITCSPTNPTGPPREVGKVDLLTSGRWSPGAVSSVANLIISGFTSTTKAVAVLPFTADASSIVSANSAWRQGLRTVLANSGTDVVTDMWRPATIGQETYLSAGVYTAYDGRVAMPYGFAHPAFLDWASLTTATTGGLITAGTYTYNTVPERRSAVGVLHRGPTAVAQTTAALSGSTNTVTLSIAPVTLGVVNPVDNTGVPEDTTIAVYRSIANMTDGILHRLSIPPAIAFVDNNIALPGTVVTLSDSSADTASVYNGQLSTRPAIYTAGGELDDFQPPACVTQVLHRNRLFLLSGDEMTVFVSKDASVNPGVAPGFHPSMTLLFSERIRALASMDDKLIALSETRPWYVLGDGPAPNGEQSDYTNPTPIQSDVGCNNPRSVVATPDGIMFQSSRGLMLLTRGLEVDFVGAAVEDTLAAFPVITSAVLVATQNQVRFTANSADGSTGRVIVYDYLARQWSLFRYTDVTRGGYADTPFVDAVMWNGAWTFVTPYGYVYSETTAHCLDGGSAWVTMRGATAWISDGGPLGYLHVRRVMLLGEAQGASPFGLKLSFGFNHAATYAQVHTWTSDDLALMPDGMNVGMHVGSQNGASPRSRAFRVAWEDVQPITPGGSYDGNSFSLSAIGIEFIPKPDMDRRSAKART